MHAAMRESIDEPLLDLLQELAGARMMMDPACARGNQRNHHAAVLGRRPWLAPCVAASSFPCLGYANGPFPPLRRNDLPKTACLDLRDSGAAADTSFRG